MINLYVLMLAMFVFGIVSFAISLSIFTFLDWILDKIFGKVK